MDSSRCVANVERNGFKVVCRHVCVCVRVNNLIGVYFKETNSDYQMFTLRFTCPFTQDYWIWGAGSRRQ